MQILCSGLPTLMVAGLYCAWNAYAGQQLRRQRTLPERVAYMLWVAVNQPE